MNDEEILKEKRIRKDERNQMILMLQNWQRFQIRLEAPTKCILEGRPEVGHPLPQYCPVCYEEAMAKARQDVLSSKSAKADLDNAYKDGQASERKRILEELKPIYEKYDDVELSDALEVLIKELEGKE